MDCCPARLGHWIARRRVPCSLVPCRRWTVPGAPSARSCSRSRLCPRGGTRYPGRPVRRSRALSPGPVAPHRDRRRFRRVRRGSVARRRRPGPRRGRASASPYTRTSSNSSFKDASSDAARRRVTRRCDVSHEERDVILLFQGRRNDAAHSAPRVRAQRRRYGRGHR